MNDKFHYDKYFQILPNGKETRVGPSEGFLDTAMTMEPKPKTIALAAADAEYAQTVIAGAREKIKALGLQIVYDRSYPPTTVDFAPVVRSIAAANPDIVYIASYPPDSVGMVRAAHEAGLKARMFGGGMIGLAFAPVKQQLGPLLNGIVAYDVYVPEPTMKFPGIEEFLTKTAYKAAAEGVDPLGFYLPPFAYAELQILGEAITRTGGLDQDKIAPTSTPTPSRPSSAGQVCRERRVGEVAHPLRAVSGHRRHRPRAVQGAGQGGYPLSARIQIGQVPLSLFRSREVRERWRWQVRAASRQRRISISRAPMAGGTAWPTSRGRRRRW